MKENLLMMMGYIRGEYYRMRQKENRYTFVPSIGFRKKMKSYFADVAEIEHKINVREYRYRNIISITEAYNEWHANR